MFVCFMFLSHTNKPAKSKSLLQQLVTLANANILVICYIYTSTSPDVAASNIFSSIVVANILLMSFLFMHGFPPSIQVYKNTSEAGGAFGTCAFSGDSLDSIYLYHHRHAAIIEAINTIPKRNIAWRCITQRERGISYFEREYHFY